MESESKIWDAARIQEAIIELESWRGTPHKNRMRTKGMGVDCINFVASILIECGIVEDVKFEYYDVFHGQVTEFSKMGALIQGALYVEQIAIEDRVFGDIVEFRTRPASVHMGFYESDNIWHALGSKAVMISPWDDYKGAVKSMFRINKLGWRNNPNQVFKKLGLRP